MAEKELREAYALMKQGDKQQATRIVQAVLKQDNKNSAAWWLLANLFEDPSKQERAAQRVLSLNPDHPGAQKLLASLRGEAVSVTTQKSKKDKPEKPKVDPHAPIHEQEFDWSKIEARDTKKENRPEAHEDNAIRIAGYLLAGFAVIVVIVIIAFAIVPTLTRNNASSAIEATVSDFFMTIFAGDFAGANELICSQYQLSQEDLDLAASFGNIFAEIDVDFSQMGVNVTSIDGDAATAQLTGEITMAMSEQGVESTVTIDIDEFLSSEQGLGFDQTTFALIKEGNQWRLCDSALEG